jgi:tRNA nucleotidyltransferase (CCA-adding enzyme)
VVETIRARGEAVAIRDLALSGDDLIQAGFTPGPGLGRVLARLLDRVIEEPRLNTRDSLLTLAKELS